MTVESENIDTITSIDCNERNKAPYLHLDDTLAQPIPEQISDHDHIIKMPLSRFVEQKISHYFSHLEGQPAQGLYDLVISEAEKGLLRIVMQKANGNQSKAADMLGLARGTLRKKLETVSLD